MRQRSRLLTLVSAFFSVIGCGRVPVKQDTPQAAVATLIKIFEAGKPELLERIVDPVIVRSDARDIACLSESLKSLDCNGKLIDCLQRHTPYCPPPPEGCPVDVKACTCGLKGTDALGKAKPFTQSSYYAGLNAMHMTAARCTITSADPVDDLTPNDTLFESACGELTPQDELSRVSFQCADDKLQLVLRKKAGVWSIVGVPAETKQLLEVRLQSAQGTEYRKKEAQTLNSDLK